MKGDYYGLPTHILSNGQVQLEFLAEAGPRLVRLTLNGSHENLLAELPDAVIPNPPYGDYRMRGGHRLWHAPEDPVRTYIPDNEGLQVESLQGNGVLLRQPTEVAAGITKSMEIHLHDERPSLTICHSLKNDGLWPVELAPWAITQLRVGGWAVLPHAAPSPKPLLSNRHLVLWPYTRWQDPRLFLQGPYVFIAAKPEDGACKVGFLGHHGWLGYLVQNVFFLKRFQPQVEQVHPDTGCNTEVYCCNQFIELETLGPMCKLEPGQSVSHTEQWEVHAAPDVPPTPDGVRALLDKLGLALAE
jgi:hypothetical protein